MQQNNIQELRHQRALLRHKLASLLFYNDEHEMRHNANEQAIQLYHRKIIKLTEQIKEQEETQ